MKYLANPCTNPVVMEAMALGRIGMIDTPLQYNPRPAGVTWAADNGCFSARWREGLWWEWLSRPAQLENVDTCLFAVAPDVVGDAVRTRELSTRWLPSMRGLGYRLAYVAQDGAELNPIPWRDFDCLFIGGTTKWKLGPGARAVAVEAKANHKWLHMGRVNSHRRFNYARAIGCDSADGTILTYGPETNLRRVLAWVASAEQPGLFVVGDDL